MTSPDALKLARWCRWMLALVGLLAYVALYTPALLLGAFNPVTTNLPALLLCGLIIRLEAGCNTAA